MLTVKIKIQFGDFCLKNKQTTKKHRTNKKKRESLPQSPTTESTDEVLVSCAP